MNPRILLYWVVVAIPLSWGVAQSINSALPLFGGKSAYIPWVLGIPPAPTAAKPSPAPTTPTPEKSIGTPAA